MYIAQKWFIANYENLLTWPTPMVFMLIHKVTFSLVGASADTTGIVYTAS